ncbi:phage tail tape measure protein [Stutzerimonas stutzeri]|uniref:phage tail tape measure protein n=1 Tax=Stutzerimonas stutzeri TaxID=316 RepID=UPI00244A396F|nr:phage tail tape measure protein [Stutzerimonas stutzeri]MDH0099949.1 phage tail tape measure protein [Stutzerimonas stutzeri]
MARDLNLKVNLQALDNATRPLRTIASGATSLGRALKDTRGELKGLQAQQKDVSSFRNLKGAADQTGGALQANRERIKALSREMAAAETPTKALTREFQSAVRQGHALKQKHNEQQRELQGLRGKLGEAGISTRNLSDHERELRQRIERTNQTMGQQEQRLKQLTAQQKRLGQAKADYDRTQQLAGSMAATGAGGLATGSGMLYAGAQLMAPGLEFDAAMSKVQALTKLDAGSEELGALRQQARDLGASTQFTAGQAADAQGFLAMAGFKQQAIIAAMPGMLDLAKAGDTDLAATADIASNILSGLGMQASEMGRMGDVLTATFSNSNTNLQMLGETMKYAAPIAKTYAVDLETVSAMAGKLGDAGIQGSMGGTALSSIMNRLAAPPKAAADALDELGVKTADAAGNLRPMPDILKEIYEKTKNLGTADRGGFLKAIAGEEAVKGMSHLVDQAGSGELQAFIAQLQSAEGSASRVSKVMADNLRGDLSAMGSAWEDLGIQLQEQQNGPMREITQTITGIIGGVKGWIAENPKLAANIVKTAAGIGVLMAGMGGLTLAIASMLGPFAMVRYGMMLFGIRGAGLAGTLFNLGKTALPLVGKGILFIGRALMMNPIGLAITAIAGGAYLIYRNWDKVGPYFLGLWNEIKTGFSGGLAGIAATIVNFSPLGLFYRAFAGVLGYLGVDLPSKFTDFGGMLMQGLANGIKNAAGAVKGAVVGAADSSIGWFKEKLGIHSPSRVFAELGGFTMAGLEQGLQAGERGPLSQLTDTAKRLTAAGAIGLSAAVGAMPAAAEPVAFDTRPPLAARAASPAGAQSAPASITVHIHAAPGQDANAIARAVAAELDRRERERGARARSSLFDQE